MFYWRIVQFVSVSGIVFSAEYFETYFVQPPRDSVDASRNAMRLDQYKWPNAEIPYEFNDDYGMMVM